MTYKIYNAPAQKASRSEALLKCLQSNPRWAETIEELASPRWINVGDYFGQGPNGLTEQGFAFPSVVERIAEQMVLKAHLNPSDRQLFMPVNGPEDVLDYGSSMRRKSTGRFFEHLSNLLWDNLSEDRPDQDVVALWYCALNQTCLDRHLATPETKRAFHIVRAAFTDIPERDNISFLRHPCKNTVEMDDDDATNFLPSEADPRYYRVPLDEIISQATQAEINESVAWVSELIFRSISSYTAEGIKYTIVANLPDREPITATPTFGRAVEKRSRAIEHQAKVESDLLNSQSSYAAELEEREQKAAENRLARVGEDQRDGLKPGSINWSKMTPEAMKKLIWEHPATSLGVLCGVSDVSIHKYCKKHDIERPGRGYWLKEDRPKPSASTANAGTPSP